MSSLPSLTNTDWHEDRRERQLADVFRAHTSPVFLHLSLQRLRDEPHSSLVTRKEVPTSGDESHEGGAISDAHEAIQQSISRSRRRQKKILALIGEGEVSMAKRMAYCARQSVQIQCSDCGSTDNFTPISCNVRLCKRCMDRRMGKAIGKHLVTVSQWDNPTLLTLTIRNSDSLSTVGEIRECFGRFRRRVIPTQGSSGGKTWDWPSWRSHLLRGTEREQREARRLEAEFVREGRGIPVDEVIKGGLYGIDVKQQSSGEFNVHIHVDCDSLWVPQSALSSVWGDVTGGSDIIDVRRITDDEGGLAETLGYVCKAPEFNDVDTEARFAAELKGSKLIQPFGDLHGNSWEQPPSLRCTDCGQIPQCWTFLGVVDGHFDTSGEVNGERADRPPPSD